MVLSNLRKWGKCKSSTYQLFSNAIGVDVNPAALQRCKEKCDFSYKTESRVYIKRGDARNLKFIPDSSIDFVCTHSPYADIIKYSDDIKKDVLRLSEKEFLLAMAQAAEESFRVLKSHKYCTILIGDMRKNGHVVLLGFSVMQKFQKAGFILKEIIIKEQHNCKSTIYWKQKAINIIFYF